MSGEGITEIVHQRNQLGVSPIVTIHEGRSAVRLSQANLSDGFPCAEITFRTGAAVESICIRAKCSQGYC